MITEFQKDSFDPETSFARIGGGSLGGKARGLGFLNTLINNYEVQRQFKGVQIAVPPAVVLGSELFDRFLDENNLRKFALESTDDLEITRRFLEAVFPEDLLGDLAAFLHLIREPLAVRSSSMLEDSQYHPFAGVYQTYMIPNNHPDPFVRLGQLVTTIKRVYASTFYQPAKDYFKVTDYRLEEEKMSVIVQKMVGQTARDAFLSRFCGSGEVLQLLSRAARRSRWTASSASRWALARRLWMAESPSGSARNIPIICCSSFHPRKRSPTIRTSFSRLI